MSKAIGRTTYLFDNKSLVTLIVPLVIEQFLAISVGLVATMMIAGVGETAVSAVALVDSILILCIGGFAALATGGAVIAGQYLGQKNLQKGCEATRQMIWFNTLIAIGLMLLIYAGRQFILQGIFGAIETDVMAQASTYLTLAAASIPFIALYNSGAAIFRGMGNSKLPMFVSLFMNLLNVFGITLLVVVLDFGVAGVGISILISRSMAAIIVIWRLCDTNQPLYLPKTFRFSPDWQMIKRTLKIGIPNGLENSMFQLGKVFLLSLISSFGTFAVAANAVSMSVAMFQILPGIAMTLAITPIVARCMGAGEFEQVDFYLKKLLKFTIIAMFVVNVIIFFLTPIILRAYNLSEQTAEITRQILLLHGIGCVIIWPLSFGIPTALRATGDVKVVMGIAIVSMWVFRIGFSYLFARFLGMGVLGVWVAMLVDWLFRSIMMGWRYRTGKWKLIRSI